MKIWFSHEDKIWYAEDVASGIRARGKSSWEAGKNLKSRLQQAESRPGG